MKEIHRLLRINNRVCAAVGSLYVHQLSLIFMDMLNIYKLYTEQIKRAIETEGQYAVRNTICKSMRSVKSEILDLMTTFLEQVAGLDPGGRADVMHQIMPSLMQEVLSDYHSSPAPARDAGERISLRT